MNKYSRITLALLVAAVLLAGCGTIKDPPAKPASQSGQGQVKKPQHPELVQPFDEALKALKSMNEASGKKDLTAAQAQFTSYRQQWERIRPALREANPGLEQHIEDGAVELDHEFGQPPEAIRYYEFDEETVKLGRLLATAADLLGVTINQDLVQKDPKTELPFNQEVTVNVTLSEHKFSPSSFEFEQHTKVTFILTNKGKEVHEFQLGHYGVDVEGLAPGKTETVTLVLLDPGEFEFSCHVLGHYEVGMFGTLKVKPAQLKK